MTASFQSPSREFAVYVVRKLREAGYESVWAGGCVRDQLLGRRPKDYDVATNATPDQIRVVFGRRRTLAIGAAFGVITVLPPKGEYQGAQSIETATFRSDATYSDGRHPDRVEFTSAEHDAQRRDFTMNGLFFDPLENRVIDYVEGVKDLEQGVVRAIGDPDERIAEDKLRMLRAIRFTATFDFRLDEATRNSITRHAPEIQVVSAERIAQEMRRMLTHPHRRRAVELLRQTRLLETILPEASRLYEDGAAWDRTLRLLDRLRDPPFATSLAALVREIHLAEDSAVGVKQSGKRTPRPGETICRRWKLSNDEVDHVSHLLSHESMVRQAQRTFWPNLQRILVAPLAKELVNFAEAIIKEESPRGVGVDDEIEFCRHKLALPTEELDPPPLITGDDLQQIGISPGPIYTKLLREVRDAQLMESVKTHEEALQMARELWKK